MRQAIRLTNGARLARGGLVALALWLACAAAFAGDLIVSRAWLEDPGGTLDADTVRARALVPFDANLTRGYSDSAFWIRLRIDPSRAPGGVDEPLVVTVGPAHLDEVTLHDPLEPERGLRVTGDRHPRALDELRSLDLNFVVPRGDAPRDLWLRVRSTGSITVRTEVKTPTERTEADRVRELGYSVALALLVLPLGWALLHWVASREALLGLFALKQSAVVLHTLAFCGYLRFALDGRLSPAAIDLASTLVHLTLPAVGLAFDLAFLRACGASPRALRLVKGLFIALPISLGLLAAGETACALALSVSAITVGAPMLAAVAAHADLRRRDAGDEPTIPRPLGALVYLMSAPAVVLTGLSLLGVVELGAFPLRASLLHGMVSGLTMVAVLQVRALGAARRQAHFEARLAATRMQVQKEREHREQNERLLSMLAHELRTPLASVRMLLARGAPSPEGVGRIQRSVDDMNAVIERCLQAVRLEDRRVRAEVVRCDVGELLADLQRGLTHPDRLRIHAPEPLRARSDPALLRVVLSNLVENAMKYGERDGAVAIDTSPMRRGALDGLSIVVSNRPGNAGWPDPTQLFRKYYRAPGAQRQTGSGLGLYLVAGLARELGGSVRYAPDDRHVRFELWVPA